jgi:hypothetical protein
MSKTERDLKVEAGMLVEVELVSRSGEVERLEFTLVEDEQADFSAGFLGSGTPLAKTILGNWRDSELDYAVGDLKLVRILSVKPSDKVQTEDVGARREAVMRKALKHSDYVNALNFATSVNSKWGDYDIAPEQWDVEE